jgi:hypothetical protein
MVRLQKLHWRALVDRHQQDNSIKLPGVKSFCNQASSTSISNKKKQGRKVAVLLAGGSLRSSSTSRNHCCAKLHCVKVSSIGFFLPLVWSS